MLTLTSWIWALKKLKSKYSRGEIRNIILENFLISDDRIDGWVYKVDDKKIWEFFVESDPVCKKNAVDRHINDPICIESWLERIRSNRQRGKSTF